MYKFPIIGGLIGLLLGYITAVTFLNTALSALTLWALIGIVICIVAKDKKRLLLTGAVYGFFTSFSFLVFDFHGSINEFVSYLPIVLAFSVVGVLIATALFAITNLVKSSFFKRSKTG